MRGGAGRGEAQKLVQVSDLQFRQAYVACPHLDSNLRQNIYGKNLTSVHFIINFYLSCHHTMWPSGKLAALDTKGYRFHARWCVPYCNFGNYLILHMTKKHNVKSLFYSLTSPFFLNLSSSSWRCFTPGDSDSDHHPRFQRWAIKGNHEKKSR